jgi:hypothetical protein
MHDVSGSVGYINLLKTTLSRSLWTGLSARTLKAYSGIAPDFVSSKQISLVFSGLKLYCVL